MQHVGKRLHLMGIAGAGMSGIAAHAASLGMVVSGCDPLGITESLEKLGIKVFDSHDPSHLNDCDILGVSTAVKNDHPEVVAAAEKDVPVARRGALLREITDGKKVIAVSGTHGKTTTTAMIAHGLREQGLDANFLVGGNAPTIGGGVGIETSEWFVLEADESDASFLGPKAEIAIVTNIEPDHLDFYGSYAKLLDAFSTFVENATYAIVCIDVPGSAGLAALPNVVTYGTSAEADWRITNVNLAASRSTATILGPESAFDIELNVPGEHALRNATAAMLAIRIVDKDSTASSLLANFENVDRRFSVRSSDGGITIIDDYAHLPAEIEAVLSAAKQLDPKRLVTVFQPHRFSRTESLHSAFADSFKESDLVIITDVYAAGESPRDGITGKLIVDDILNQNPLAQVIYVPDRNQVAKILSDRLKTGDVVLTLGAGDITKLSHELSELQRDG